MEAKRQVAEQIMNVIDLIDYLGNHGLVTEGLRDLSEDLQSLIIKYDL